jgi:hypothetical protein
VVTFPFQYNDGGRQESGFKGSTGDCFVRAAAIASGLPYSYIYDLVKRESQNERAGKKKKSKSSPREGVYPRTAERILLKLGFEKVSVMGIGTGCKAHLRSGEIPEQGRVVLNLSMHYAAVVDGTLLDTFDCSRNGTRCVYSYYVNKIYECAKVEEN